MFSNRSLRSVLRSEKRQSRGDLVHAYLGTFLHHPFQSLDVLRRRDGDMQVEIVRFRLFLLRDNLKLAVLRVGVGDTRLVGVTHAVGEQYLVAARVAQDTHAVRGLLLAQAPARKYIGGIE